MVLAAQACPGPVSLVLYGVQKSLVIAVVGMQVVALVVIAWFVLARDGDSGLTLVEPRPVAAPTLDADREEAPSAPVTPVAETPRTSRNLPAEAVAAREELREALRASLVGQLRAVAAEDDRAPLTVAGLTIPYRRVAILVDDGGSTLNRYRARGGSRDQFRQTVADWLEAWSPEEAFALVTFVRQVGTWEDRWRVGTAANREQARAWVQERLGGSKKETSLELARSGVEGALEAAALLGAEACLVVSDGSFQRVAGRGGGTQVKWDELRSWWQELTGAHGPMALYWVTVAPSEEDRAAFTTLIEESGGAVVDF